MITDYKNTLNLPTTEFPMKANLAQREPEILKRWEEIKLYHALREQKRKEKFILMDGPIYANGNIHLGHSLNRVLKDIVNKSQSLSGYDTPFIPGWDCHGLPIELNVEKKLGKSGVNIAPEKFRQACRDYAVEQINIQREEFKRLGVLGDWEHPYATMDKKFEADIIRALAKIIANGFVVQGFKPVHWCFDCGSALAEAEVEYANKVSPALDVRFRVINEKEFLAKFNLKENGAGAISVPIWTTTPWTLPANEAVSLHPEFNYVLVQANNERLLLAEQLLESSLKRYAIVDYKILGKTAGQQLERILLQHPFYNKQVPIIVGEHVTADTGTGAVHTAPAHGQDDYAIGQKYHLEFVNPVGKNGCFLPNTAIFAGEHVLKANAHIIEILKERGNLVFEAKLEHSYPHCWRHKTPLIFLATSQWFISLENNLASAAEDAAKQVNWVPAWGLTNMTGMVANRPDWCISRQRNWGSPITLFIHKETRKLHPDTVNLMEKIAVRVEKEGMESWFSSTPSDWLGAAGDQYEKVTDTLDVWFDSGVVQYAVLQQRPELQFPADVILEGTDQYRGWFQSLLLTAVAMQIKINQGQTAIAPYKNVITHGFTVDDKGRKMSKSLGNVIPPEKIWNTLGADILRLWVSSTDYTAEIPLSDEILKRVSEAYRRIRNTARYFLSNLFDFEPTKDLVAPENLLFLDRWALQRAAELQQQIQAAYDRFDFRWIYQAINNFCIVDMGGFYLDLIKDRQYTTQKNSLARRSGQTAMFYLAEAMVRWLAPILSFTAEEIWQYLPGEHGRSVFLTTWYDKLDRSSPNFVVVNDEDRLLAGFNFRSCFDYLKELRNEVNKELEKCRIEGEIGSPLEAEVTLYADPAIFLAKLPKELLDKELRFVLITSGAEVIISSQLPEDAVIANVHGDKIGIKVKAANYPKCARCWHRRADVGKDVKHPDICERCVENIDGNGEVRQFA